MMFGSVCSGIEAATIAWGPLGWLPMWYSEIEHSPCKVIEYHHMLTPNLGDMTKLNNHAIYRNTDIDLLVGGTPCQSFSIAGLRRGLDDERGNLALEFCRILLDKQPKWFVWENVPGVFSSFSSEADGKDVSGDSIGDGRENRADNTEEVVETSDFAAIIAAFQECGYSVAWRVFDSQYFGVPQRRRRVFVVGHLGNDWRPPVAVLFERDILRRDFTPGKETRKGAAPSTGSSAAGESGKCLNPQDPQVWRVHEAKNNVSPCVDSETGRGRIMLIEQPAFCIQSSVVDKASMQNGSGVKEECAFTLIRTDRHVVAAPMMLKMREGCAGGGKGPLLSEEKSFTISTQQDQTLIQPVAFTQNQSGDVLTGNVMHSLATNANSTGRNAPNILCLNDQGGSVMGVSENIAPTLRAQTHGNNPIIINPKYYIVRRLTPLECERLQGFPDNYTNVPGMSDSSRYACIGNSMTVNVMRWIGKRIDTVDKLLTIIKK